MLQTPNLLYGTGALPHHQRQNLFRGRWNLQQKTFVDRATLPVLGVLHFTQSDMYAYRSFSNALTTCGVRGPANRPVFAQHVTRATAPHLTTALRQQTNRALQAILVMLPTDVKAHEYAAIKTWADTQAGVNTVCITADKADSLTNPAFQANIALKFNAKLGGENHRLAGNALQPLNRNGGHTMVVGADVMHPGVGSVEHCPSAAAVVASENGRAVTYPGSLRLQNSKQEMIENLDVMICERLMHWHTQNGSLPANILFYCDGVSDSQFASVKQVELPKIQLGCSQAAANVGVQNYVPHITLVVCGKRHNTRFYAPTQQLPNNL